MLSSTEHVDKLVNDYSKIRHDAAVKSSILDPPKKLDLLVQGLLEAFQEVLDAQVRPGQVVKTLRLNLARVKLRRRYERLCTAPSFLRYQRATRGRKVATEAIDFLVEELQESECPIDRKRLKSELEASRIPLLLGQKFGMGIFAILKPADLQR